MTNLRKGQLVRISAPLEVTVADFTTDHDRISVWLDVSDVTPVITPEPGDVWKTADGALWVCYSQGKFAAHMMQAKPYPYTGTRTVKRFLENHPQAVRVFDGSSA